MTITISFRRLFVIFAAMLCVLSMHGAVARTLKAHNAIRRSQNESVTLAVLEYQIRHHATLRAASFIGYRGKAVSPLLLRRLDSDGFKAQPLSDAATNGLLFTDKRTHQLAAIYAVSKPKYRNNDVTVVEMRVVWGRLQGEILRCDVHKIHSHWIVTKSIRIGEI